MLSNTLQLDTYHNNSNPLQFLNWGKPIVFWSSSTYEEIDIDFGIDFFLSIFQIKYNFLQSSPCFLQNLFLHWIWNFIRNSLRQAHELACPSSSTWLFVLSIFSGCCWWWCTTTGWWTVTIITMTLEKIKRIFPPFLVSA